MYASHGVFSKPAANAKDLQIVHFDLSTTIFNSSNAFIDEGALQFLGNTFTLKINRSVKRLHESDIGVTLSGSWSPDRGCIYYNDVLMIIFLVL